VRQSSLDSIDALRYLPDVEAEKLIKRYDNRKLYDPEAARYVTLGELGRLVSEGAELKVVDQKSGEDLTTLVLAQVILEGIREKTASIPRQVLARLIRFGLRQAFADWPRPQDFAGRARREAERIAEGLISRGRLTLEEALGLRQEITGTVQRLVTEAQHGLEGRLRGLLDRSEKEAGVNPALLALKERLLSFETHLGEPPPAPARRRAGRGAAARRSPKKKKKASKQRSRR
jgi:polyhydroxyalkanoate synthesis repressor PhaR